MNQPKQLQAIIQGLEQEWRNPRADRVHFARYLYPPVGNN